MPDFLPYEVKQIPARITALCLLWAILLGFTSCSESTEPETVESAPPPAPTVTYDFIELRQKWDWLNIQFPLFVDSSNTHIHELNKEIQRYVAEQRAIFDSIISDPYRNRNIDPYLDIGYRVYSNRDSLISLAIDITSDFNFRHPISYVMSYNLNPINGKEVFLGDVIPDLHTAQDSLRLRRRIRKAAKPKPECEIRNAEYIFNTFVVSNDSVYVILDEGQVDRICWGLNILVRP